MTKKINIKLVGGLFGIIIAVSLIAGFLTATDLGRAVFFALTDPQTTLEASELKSSYVNEFTLGLEQ